MHKPLATMGELAVKNWGQARKSSRRQRFLPVEASKHDNVPRTPSVTTLPSATVGELRGPACGPPAGDVAGCTSYLFCQITLPELASRQRMTSSPSCRVK